MQITAERLAELHKLQEVYIPQLFERATVKKKEILNLAPLHVETIVKFKQLEVLPTERKLWRTTTKQMQMKRSFPRGMK